MRIQTKLTSLLLLAWVGSAVGQIGNPSVSSAAAFEQYPVSLETGLPAVGFPLQKMATHSKDLDVSISLNYHQSSIAVNSRRSGNCGRGWNISATGSIQRIIRAYEQWQEYSFTFMGYSGTFRLIPKVTGGIDVIIAEKSGAKLYAEYHEGSNLQIIDFIFYDGKGHKFEFKTFDDIWLNKDEWRRMSFQLTDVFDAMNNLLVHYDYDTITETIEHDRIAHTPITRDNTLNVLKKVNVIDYGSVEFLYETLPDIDGNWLLYNNFLVKDAFNNTIKSGNFSYSPYSIGAVTRSYNITLSGFSISGGGKGPESYSFSYKPITVLDENNALKEGVDQFGYRNAVTRYCEDVILVNGFSTEKFITEGVLEKITYPDGGSVIYDYEPNITGVDISNPEVLYDLEHVENRRNYDFIELVNTVNTEFTLTQTTEVYIKTFGTKVLAPPGMEDYGSNEPGYIFPTFSLVKMGSGTSFSQVGTTIKMTDNADNYCMGRKVTLSPGKYKLTRSAFGDNIQVLVYRISRKAAPLNWDFSGGVRIKRIAYFTTNAPQNYFRPDAGQTFPFVAAKLEYYTYSNSFVSSGTEETPTNNNAVYPNVTVSNIFGDKRRTEYTFDSLRDSKLTNMKVYNAQNVLQQETLTDYYTYTLDDNDSKLYLPKEIITREYLGGTLEKNSTFEYDANRRIKTKTTSTSRSAESLITNFYYHLNANGIPYSFNRFGEIDHVDEFINTRPIATTKIEYGNSWQNAQGTTVNTTYQAFRMLKGKGSGNPELQIKNNIYDKYGNILETEDAAGLKKCYVFGYNDTVLIAEITGVGYAALPATLVTAAKNASNVNNNEAALLTALTNLRNASQLSTGLITTYTYKPSVGISTVTDPRGYRMKYEYDLNGRQVAVRDEAGNLITDTVYHNIYEN